jgi:YbgC/YbaW family acyl-CoA thioester hydrolase
MARVKLEIPVHKIFTANIPVRITDINYGNHVGNDALVSIVHEARVQWLAQNNYTELNVGGAALIMADLAIEYKAESFYGDTLTVAISIGEITKISFEIFYEITIARNDKKILIANAKTGMVCFDYEARKVTSIPEAFGQMINSK